MTQEASRSIENLLRATEAMLSRQSPELQRYRSTAGRSQAELETLQAAAAVLERLKRGE